MVAEFTSKIIKKQTEITENKKHFKLACFLLIDHRKNITLIIKKLKNIPKNVIDS